jgi:hypothetical protein
VDKRRKAQLDISHSERQLLLASAFNVPAAETGGKSGESM